MWGDMTYLHHHVHHHHRHHHQDYHHDHDQHEVGKTTLVRAALDLMQDMAKDFQVLPFALFSPFLGVFIPGKWEVSELMFHSTPYPSLHSPTRRVIIPATLRQRVKNVASSTVAGWLQRMTEWTGCPVKNCGNVVDP